MENQQLVTVIVPVYNVGAFLPQCLESIVGQTYERLEVICVDDGSTDDSGRIAEQWAKRDDRIFVIHQENRGLSGARNTGLCAASGEFVLFVDSDDWIDREAVERLVAAIRETDADFALFGHREWLESERKMREGFAYEERLLAAPGDWVTHGTNEMAWSKFFRTEFLEQNCLRFPEGIYFEDAFFFWLCVSHAKRMLRLTDVLYNYRIRPNSIMAHALARRPGRAVHILRGLEFLREKWMESGYWEEHRALFTLLFAWFTRNAYLRYASPSEQDEFLAQMRWFAKAWGLEFERFTPFYDLLERGREGNRHVYRIAHSVRKRFARLSGKSLADHPKV